MPRVPFVTGSDTSEAAASRLRTRFLVAETWIGLASRPEGVIVREVEHQLSKYDSGPSARQSELVRAGVLVKHGTMRRLSCGVYHLLPGLTPEGGRQLYAQWVATSASVGRRRSRASLPSDVASAYAEAVQIIRRTGSLSELDEARTRLWEAVYRSVQ